MDSTLVWSNFTTRRWGVGHLRARRGLRVPYRLCGNNRGIGWLHLARNMERGAKTVWLELETADGH